MAEERIQKIMAEQGLCSRRAAEQIIAEGRVKVNGHPVKVGDKMDPNRDVLHVDDERIYRLNPKDIGSICLQAALFLLSFNAE